MPKMVQFFSTFSFGSFALALAFGCAYPAKAASPLANQAPSKKADGGYESIIQSVLYPAGAANSSYEAAGYASQVGCQGELLEPAAQDIVVEAWACGASNGIDPKMNGKLDLDKPVLVYFHGNGENVYSVYRENMFQVYARLFKVNVVTFDYPGYGRSTGAANEKTLTAAGVATIEWIQKLWQEQGGQERPKIIMMGYSLGTGVAMQTLKQVPDLIDRLILVAPWSTFAKAVQAKISLMGVPLITENKAKSLVVGHQYDSYSVAKEVNVPTLIVHGNEDNVIPSKEGKRLFAALKTSEKTFKLIPSEHPGAAVHRHTKFAISKFLRVYPLD